MKFYNTLTRKLEEFTPLEGEHVRMYTCGPTVYDFAHIGNFRAYIFEDLLRRYLKYSGYTVTQVMNLTDIDDKTIKGAGEAGVSLSEYTSKYKKSFFDDLKTLNIEPAEHYPEATAHVPEMMTLIRKLFDNGYAYQSDDGSVYFSISKFKDYGKLAHLDTEGLLSGARVAQDEYDKENVADFALWKAWNESDGDVVWDSPWGRGRPGWHIECSAMSMKYLGESFDIHTGGVDNIFPHHENEIAQSEGATGKKFVNCWLHCGYLIVNGKKMSKSLGNFYTLQEIIEKGYSGREVRYVLMSAQYRQQLNFTFDALNSARSSIARLDEFKDRVSSVGCSCLAEASNSAKAMLDKSQGRRVSGGNDDSGQNLPVWAEKAREKFKAALDNDLNMPEALAAIFDMIHEGNRIMDAGTLAPGEADGILGVLNDFDRVLGLSAKPGEKPGEDVLELVQNREEARKTKNWAESDRIRDELKKLGWSIKDTSQGPELKKM